MPVGARAKLSWASDDPQARGGREVQADVGLAMIGTHGVGGVLDQQDGVGRRAPRPSGRRGGPTTGTRRLIQVSTASGFGKDTYVQPPAPRRSPSPHAVLLVKNTADAMSAYHRKAYIGLDLAPASGLRIVRGPAQLRPRADRHGLRLRGPPTPPSACTAWSTNRWTAGDEATTRWDDAPANAPGGAGLDPDKVVPLGRFGVEQGVLSGIREVSGPALVDFLNRDTNGLATFILVRETRGSGRLDLVHGFAGKHHPDLPPPTLKLTRPSPPGSLTGRAAEGVRARPIPGSEGQIPRTTPATAPIPGSGG